MTVVKLMVMFLSKNSFHVFIKSLHVSIFFCWFKVGRSVKWKKLWAVSSRTSPRAITQDKEEKVYLPLYSPQSWTAQPPHSVPNLQLLSSEKVLPSSPTEVTAPSVLVFCCCSHHIRSVSHQMPLQAQPPQAADTCPTHFLLINGVDNQDL